MERFEIIGRVGSSRCGTLAAFEEVLAIADQMLDFQIKVPSRHPIALPNTARVPCLHSQATLHGLFVKARLLSLPGVDSQTRQECRVYRMEDTGTLG